MYQRHPLSAHLEEHARRRKAGPMTTTPAAEAREAQLRELRAGRVRELAGAPIRRVRRWWAARNEARRLPLTALEDLTSPEAVASLAVVAPVELDRLSEASLRGQRVLGPTDRRYLVALVSSGIHAASSGLVGLDDASRTPILTAFAQRVETIGDFVSRREGEISRRRYAGGLGLGVVFSVLVLLTVGVVATVVIKYWVAPTGGQWTQADIGAYNRLALRDTLVVIGGGAAGAAVSVLLRLHRVPDLKVETVGSGTAMFRIFLGWFFAVALLALIKGGIAANLVADPSLVLLDGDRGNDTPAVIVGSWFFWAAMGFLAGFNERWATTIIARDPGSAVASADPPPKPGQS